MANYRLISGDPNEVNRELTIMSAKNREGKSAIEKPILLSSTVVRDPKGGVHLALHLIVES
jgi:hypothetical protein